MFLVTLEVTNHIFLYGKISQNNVFCDPPTSNLLNVTQKIINRSHYLTCWTSLSLISLNTGTVYACRSCQESTKMTTFIANSALMPFCQQCMTTKIVPQYNHYIYVYWILKQYIIDDITTSILQYLARPIKN